MVGARGTLSAAFRTFKRVAIKDMDKSSFYSYIGDQDSDLERGGSPWRNARC
jgi:hypothetical protein